jgi:hypothetical protein
MHPRLFARKFGPIGTKRPLYSSLNCVANYKLPARNSRDLARHQYTGIGNVCNTLGFKRIDQYLGKFQPQEA